MIASRHMEAFRTAIAGPDNQPVRQWKQAGRPVVGHFCSFVPVEIVTAAGALAVRLRGAGSTDSGPADAYLSSRTCTYVRHTLTLALEGAYDFLDGEIGLNTCDHVRRAFDLWRHKTSVAFHAFVSVPRNARESLYPFYREEIANLKTALERHFSVSITDEDLRRAVSLHNRARERLVRFDELRSGQRPSLSGADMLTVSVASQVMDPETFIQKADTALQALTQEPSFLPESRGRLLMAGGELDEPAFIQAVESQSAIVAADHLCFGMRTNRALVDENAPDLLDALCRRYFFAVPCARMIGNFNDRVGAILETVRDRRIDGVVAQRLKFCDPWGGEVHNLRHRLARHDIPFLVLEREYGRVSTGQVKTRVQAFLELIESKKRSAGRAHRTSGNNAPVAAQQGAE